MNGNTPTVSLKPKQEHHWKQKNGLLIIQYSYACKALFHMIYKPASFVSK